jgi:hypothetical protein
MPLEDSVAGTTRQTGRRAHRDRRRHDRLATLQWTLLAVALVLGTIAAFVLFDGAGAITHGG